MLRRASASSCSCCSSSPTAAVEPLSTEPVNNPALGLLPPAPARERLGLSCCEAADALSTATILSTAYCHQRHKSSSLRSSISTARACVNRTAVAATI